MCAMRGVGWREDEPLDAVRPRFSGLDDVRTRFTASGNVFLLCLCFATSFVLPPSLMSPTLLLCVRV